MEFSSHIDLTIRERGEQEQIPQRHKPLLLLTEPADCIQISPADFFASMTSPETKENKTHLNQFVLETPRADYAYTE